MKILYWCNYGRMGGYSRAAHDYIMALAAAGADVRIEPLLPPEPAWAALEPRYRMLGELLHNGIVADGFDVEIFHAPPSALASWLPKRRSGGPKRVAITTWETSPLPLAYAEVLRRFDAVVTPSRFCAKLLESPESVTHVVPHCYDPDFWDLDEVESAPSDRMTFYTVGAWNDRKNHAGLLRAYLHAFTADDPVRMVISAQGADIRAAMSLLARSGIPEKQWPSLVILPPERPLHETELRQLHADGDVFVSASRGEGWHLGLFEARVMGKEVITTITGEDYLAIAGAAGEGVFRVPARSTPVFPDEGPATVDDNGRVTATITAPRGSDCKQVWLEPDLVAMAKIMRAVAVGADQHLFDVHALRAAMEERYSYRVVGPQLLRVLEGIVR
jgi:glycosyltransferase involved in cell wall biosynthesis